VNGLTKLGLQQVVWPSPEAAWERLVAALEAQADDEPEEGKERVLRQAAKSLRTAGQSISVGLLSEVLKRAVLG